MLDNPPHRLCSLVCWFALALCLLANQYCLAGPPFLTDDPDPVPYHHWELYTFSSGDRTRDTNSVSGPALELNNGVARNTQLHLVIPEFHYRQPGLTGTGLGDTEAGVKYKFLSETTSRPEAGFFPMAEISTGNQERGLGNGKTWYRLPIWLQKSDKRFTVDTGCGYVINPEIGQRNYSYGGILLQYETNSKLTFGSEVYTEGAEADTSSQDFEAPGARSSTLWNIGGYYNFTPDFSLLFSSGHSLAGQGNTVFYLGLYRTWGPGSE